MRRRRFGLSDEVALFLSAAVLLLVLVSTFTLVSYRTALELLADERREEAGRAALQVVAALPAGRPPASDELARLAPSAVRVTLTDAGGRALVSAGPAAVDGPVAEPLAPLRAAASADAEPPWAVGPTAGAREVWGFAPVGEGGGRGWVRVDLPAASLASQVEGVRVLTIVVVAVDVAVALLLLVFLRRILQPVDRLIERARGLGQGEERGELTGLLRTFEAALAALEEPPPAGGGDDAEMTALSTTLARSLASGVLLLDEEGGVVALNEVGARLLGIEAPEPGTPLADALAPVPELVDRLAEAVAGRSGMRREEVTVEGRAGRLTLGITVHPLRRDDGRVRGHLTLFTDLTETRRQEIEEKLAESLADLGELAAGVAHELRNGMATLRGYLTLMDRAPGEESMADYLGEVRREADSLQRVLEDFLTFARPGSARLEEVDLTTVVRRAAADPALAGAPVRVVVAGDGPALLRGDAELLGRAVRNLLANAVEASRHAGGAPVEVLLERRGDDWRLAVDDRGAGLPPAVRARLFQPFVAGRPGGVGLGLALAHRIVSLHGGRLRMEDRPGGGTRAVALLPVGGSVTIGNDSSVPVAPGSPGGKLPSSAGSTG